MICALLARGLDDPLCDWIAGPHDGAGTEARGTQLRHVGIELGLPMRTVVFREVGAGHDVGRLGDVQQHELPAEASRHFADGRESGQRIRGEVDGDEQAIVCHVPSLPCRGRPRQILLKRSAYVATLLTLFGLHLGVSGEDTRTLRALTKKLRSCEKP